MKNIEIPLQDNERIVFHVVMDRNKFGLSEAGAMLHDMAEEYAVVECARANAGLLVYGKYNGFWQHNPWSMRFLIRVLLENAGIPLCQIA